MPIQVVVVMNVLRLLFLFSLQYKYMHSLLRLSQQCAAIVHEPDVKLGDVMTHVNGLGKRLTERQQGLLIVKQMDNIKIRVCDLSWGRGWQYGHCGSVI